MKLVAKLFMLGIGLEILILGSMALSRHNLTTQLIKSDNICVTWDSKIFTWHPYLEWHKPKYYDYGEFGKGRYCPTEDYPKLPNADGTGMLAY